MSNTPTKTVLITGVSSGIGAATAAYFIKKGWNVVGITRPGSAPDAALVNSAHFKNFECDIASEESVTEIVPAVWASFGSIDVLVNNAGYGLIGPLEALTSEQMQAQFETNVFGTMRMTRLCLPYMRKRGKGTVIIISSMFGRISMPFFTAYTASKWAVEGFAEALFQEIKPFGIHVRLIEPGAIKTRFFENAVRAQMSPETSAYEPRYKKFMSSIDGRGEHGDNPELVARAVYAAVSSGPLRRTPDFTAKLLTTVRRFLPLSVFTRIIRVTIG